MLQYNIVLVIISRQIIQSVCVEHLQLVTLLISYQKGEAKKGISLDNGNREASS